MRLCGSTPTVGSSKISSFGRCSSPMPIFSRRFNPPGILLRLIAGPVGQAGHLQHLRTAPPRLRGGHAVQPGEEHQVLPGRKIRVNSQVLRHVADGALGPDREWVVIGSPATTTSPPSRSSRPAIIEIVVVLPAPFGPSSPYVSPAPMWNPTPSTATSSPKLRRRPRHSSIRMPAIATPSSPAAIRIDARLATTRLPTARGQRPLPAGTFAIARADVRHREGGQPSICSPRTPAAAPHHGHGHQHGPGDAPHPIGHSHAPALRGEARQNG